MQGKLCAYSLYFMLACAHFLCTVFATSVAVSHYTTGPLQLSRTGRTTGAGGRDAAGTGKFLTFNSRARN